MWVAEPVRGSGATEGAVPPTDPAGNAQHVQPIPERHSQHPRTQEDGASPTAVRNVTIQLAGKPLEEKRLI